MPIPAAPNGAKQALVAASTSRSLIAQPAQLLAAGNGSASAAPADNLLSRLAFLVAGTLLALASVAIAGTNGWCRGASLPESVIWAGAGVALALVSLFGLSLVLTHHGQRRAAAGIAWSLGLAFTVVAALGSQHGGRELAGRTDTAITGERTRLEATYNRASDELAALSPSRPASVIEQELAVILKDVRLRDCRGWLESRRLRTICVERVEPARAEQSIARERERLQTAMADATAALSKLTVGKSANTDASAIERYLAAVGIHVGTQRLADLLNLWTVIAIEVCGSVAIALGRGHAATAGHSMGRCEPRVVNTAVNTSRDGGVNTDLNTPLNTPPSGVQSRILRAPKKTVNTRADAKTAATIERLKQRILGDLERGPRSCSQRALASELGASVGYVNKAIHELAAAGVVNVSTSKAGTVVELVTA